MKKRKAAKLSLSFLLLIHVSFLFSCSTKDKIKPVVFRSPDEVPRTVAVLPLRNDTTDNDIDQKVRESIAGHLAVLNYRDIELSEVDLRLDNYAQETGQPLEQMSVEEIGFILNCDAVVFGEVTVDRKLFLGFYAQLAVGACIEIWDTRSGEMIWADRHVVRYHKGGLPTEPVGLLVTGYGTVTSLRDYMRWRAIDELGRYLVDNLPQPDYPLQDTFTAYLYEVQLAAFLTQDKANSLVEKLKSANYSAFVRTNHDNRGLWYRVLMGPFSTQLEAERLRNEIAQRFNIEPVLLTAPAKKN